MGIYKEIRELFDRGCSTETAMDIAAIVMTPPGTTITIKTRGQDYSIVVALLDHRDTMSKGFGKVRQYLHRNCIFSCGDHMKEPWFSWETMTSIDVEWFEFGILTSSSQYVHNLQSVTVDSTELIAEHKVNKALYQTPIGKFVIDELIRRITFLKEYELLDDSQSSQQDAAEAPQQGKPDSWATVQDFPGLPIANPGSLLENGMIQWAHLKTVVDRGFELVRQMTTREYQVSYLDNVAPVTKEDGWAEPFLGFAVDDRPHYYPDESNPNNEVMGNDIVISMVFQYPDDKLFYLPVAIGTPVTAPYQILVNYDGTWYKNRHNINYGRFEYQPLQGIPEIDYRSFIHALTEEELVREIYRVAAHMPEEPDFGNWNPGENGDNETCYKTAGNEPLVRLAACIHRALADIKTRDLTASKYCLGTDVRMCNVEGVVVSRVIGTTSDNSDSNVDLIALCAITNSEDAAGSLQEEAHVVALYMFDYAHTDDEQEKLKNAIQENVLKRYLDRKSCRYMSLRRMYQMKSTSGYEGLRIRVNTETDSYDHTDIITPDDLLFDVREEALRLIS